MDCGVLSRWAVPLLQILHILAVSLSFWIPNETPYILTYRLWSAHSQSQTWLLPALWIVLSYPHQSVPGKGKNLSVCSGPAIPLCLASWLLLRHWLLLPVLPHAYAVCFPALTVSRSLSEPASALESSSSWTLPLQYRSLLLPDSSVPVPFHNGLLLYHTFSSVPADSCDVQQPLYRLHS